MAASRGSRVRPSIVVERDDASHRRTNGIARRRSIPLRSNHARRRMKAPGLLLMSDVVHWRRSAFKGTPLVDARVPVEMSPTGATPHGPPAEHFERAVDDGDIPF
jgi:hypothetical protein